MPDLSAPTSPDRPAPSSRLQSIDFFRGLALAFVLLSHLDWASGNKILRPWLPVGLGFSSGAEAFVFLSGLVFGWVYSARLAKAGLRASLRRVVVRMRQLYGGYLITLAAITALSLAPIGMTEWTRNALRLGPGRPLGEVLVQMATLQEFPYGIDILGFYILMLPCLLSALALARRARGIVAAISIGLWLAVQPSVSPALSAPVWLSGWSFHPLAWQLLIVTGMLIGDHARRTQSCVPRHRLLAALAGAVALYGLVSAKRSLLVGLTGISDPRVLQWVDLSTSWLTAKTTLGPLRIVHFASVAYLLAYGVASRPPNWSSPWLRPVIVSGRHSLAVFCCGSVMVYAAAIPFYRVGNDPWVVAGIGLFACLAQFAVAAWLERRARKSDLRVSQFEAAMT